MPKPWHQHPIGQELHGQADRLRVFHSRRPEDSGRVLSKGSERQFGQRTGKDEGSGPYHDAGTLGFDVSYIREIKTPTGRSIRFVTNRRIAFGESYWSTRSKSFNLTAGEIRINDQDKNKSDGVLYPATQLTINKDGEPQWDLRMNPWKLNNIIVWPSKDKEK